MTRARGDAFSVASAGNTFTQNKAVMTHMTTGHQARRAAATARPRAMASGRRIALAATLAALAAACGEAAPDESQPSTGPVVTLLDYFDLGESEVDRFLARDPVPSGGLTPAGAREAAAAVVRVRIVVGRASGELTTTHATGSLVDGGRHVLTVGHAAAAARAQAGARVELVLGDGRLLSARLADLSHYDEQRSETDWALLEIVDPPEGLPALEIAAPVDGERLLLGFPGRVGFAANGAATVDPADRHEPLQPVRVLCHAADANAARLDVLAGSIPIGGMSGAPCVDARGRLVAMQRAVTDDVTADGVRWSIDVVALDAARAVLAR